jgi:hypothetical protein
MLKHSPVGPIMINSLIALHVILDMSSVAVSVIDNSGYASYACFAKITPVV